MQISVVIPTCNRKARLLSLLYNLSQSEYPVQEVIIVDSGEDALTPEEYAFTSLPVQYIRSEKSVCRQRNTGIQMAVSPWIFLCDDDMEVPSDYLQKLSEHVQLHPEAGAISGLVLQKNNNGWEDRYPVRSARMLLWKFVFQLGIWGGITCNSNNILIRKIKKYYHRKGNHLSKAGWPVITDFSNDYFICPVYGLGASLVRKEWLLHSPYDEVLDRHGIGDNYGVAMGFPEPGIHVLTNACVYHHQEPVNRLQRPLQYMRRVLALDYFVNTKPRLRHVTRIWLLWSLTGNLLAFILVRDGVMIRPACQSIWRILWRQNPYIRAARENQRVVEPMM